MPCIHNTSWVFSRGGVIASPLLPQMKSYYAQPSLFMTGGLAIWETYNVLCNFHEFKSSQFCKHDNYASVTGK